MCSNKSLSLYSNNNYNKNMKETVKNFLHRFCHFGTAHAMFLFSNICLFSLHSMKSQTANDTPYSLSIPVIYYVCPARNVRFFI